MGQVLMICTGNICRSAMAEVVLRELIAQEKSALTVDSCGISAEEQGNPMDYRAQQVLRENGYPWDTDHRARKITLFDLQENDLLLAMTYHHYAVVRRLIEQAKQSGQLGEKRPELRMIREFEPENYAQGQGLSELAISSRGQIADLEDPWYGGILDFRSCLATIERCLPQVLHYLENSY